MEGTFSLYWWEKKEAKTLERNAKRCHYVEYCYWIHFKNRWNGTGPKEEDRENCCSFCISYQPLAKSVPWEEFLCFSALAPVLYGNPWVQTARQGQEAPRKSMNSVWETLVFSPFRFDGDCLLNMVDIIASLSCTSVFF